MKDNRFHHYQVKLQLYGATRKQLSTPSEPPAFYLTWRLMTLQFTLKSNLLIYNKKYT